MPNIVRFDCFEVDLGAGQLRKRGVRMHLRDKSFQVLEALLSRPGEVVTREELRRKLWHDEVFVDFDNNLNTSVGRLREALNDSADRPRFIETLPKRGYRFIAAVTTVTSTGGAGHKDVALRRRIVVLPFVDLSADGRQDYFSDAVTEEIITELAAIAPRHLGVIARTTAMAYKGPQKDLARIGRQLNVDYLVEGSVRREDQRVAVAVQLIRATDQTHLFARRYEASLKTVFALRTPIAHAIATHVESPALTNEMRGRVRETSARRKPTESIAAYNEYIQGRHLVERMTPASLAAAKRHFEAAIACDPAFALAYAGLADCYSTIGYFGYTRPKDAFSAGVDYARRAVDLDDTLAEAHAVLAEYHKQLDYDWVAAEREMKRALELDPLSPLVRTRNAVAVLMPHGRLDEAIAELSEALESSPLDRLTRSWLACMHLIRGDYEDTIAEAHRLLEIEPTSPFAHFFLACAYRQLHYEIAIGARPAPEPPHPKYAEEAVRAHLKSIELTPGSTFFVGWLGMTYGMLGRETDARAVLQQLRRAPGYTLPSAFGHTYLGLGDIDATLEWFGRAVEERDQMMMPIRSYLHFEWLTSQPGFLALIEKMKLG